MLQFDDPEKCKLLHEDTTSKIIGAAFELHDDKRDEAQLPNELKATRPKGGMLVNFGRTKVEYSASSSKSVFHPCSSVAE